MHLHQLMTWQPIATLKTGKAEEKPRKPKASQDTLGLANGDVYAVDPAVKRPDYETPTEERSVDVRI